MECDGRLPRGKFAVLVLGWSLFAASSCPIAAQHISPPQLVRSTTFPSKSHVSSMPAIRKLSKRSPSPATPTTPSTPTDDSSNSSSESVSTITQERKRKPRLTPDERAKRKAERAIRNRLAAQESRDRKKHEWEEMQQQLSQAMLRIKELERENANLRVQSTQAHVDAVSVAPVKPRILDQVPEQVACLDMDLSLSPSWLGSSEPARFVVR